MSTDEYSQELPDEMYLHHRTPSAASTSYPNLGSSSSCSLPMPANMEMAMMAHNKPQQAHHHHHHHGQAQSSQHQQQQMMSSGLDHLQRQPSIQPDFGQKAVPENQITKEKSSKGTWNSF
ncbi:hypothetical protein BLOT_014825 [Blomia tropicalis]|nr:hypothetical protein BLOT_014825 [Blomia tropicalis]